MKKFLMSILALGASAAFAQVYPPPASVLSNYPVAGVQNYFLSGIMPVQQQAPAYLIEHVDNPILKSFIEHQLEKNQVLVGVIDFTNQLASYGGGVPGTYPLIDQASGTQLTLPIGSIIKNALVYSTVSPTVSGAPTLSVGYSGAPASIVGVSTASAFVSGHTYEGIPQWASAPSMVLNGVTATPLTTTLTGATVNTGRVYILMDTSRGLN